MSEDLPLRVSKLEEDVSELKVSTATIGASLEALKESSAERHEFLKEQLQEIKTALRCDDATAHARWIREIFTPQTIAIVAAILASAMGAPWLASTIMEAPPADKPAVEFDRSPSPSTAP